MDRRSFLTTLIGGLAAAGLGGTAVARTVPAPLVPAKDTEELPTGLAEALDETEAEFSQHRRRRHYRRRYRPRYYYRPYRRYYRRRRYYRPWGYYRRPRRYYYRRW